MIKNCKIRIFDVQNLFRNELIGYGLTVTQESDGQELSIRIGDSEQILDIGIYLQRMEINSYLIINQMKYDLIIDNNSITKKWILSNYKWYNLLTYPSSYQGFWLSIIEFVKVTLDENKSFKGLINSDTKY